MNKDLLSLSLTDMQFNNSENTTSDIMKMIVQTGGEFEYNNTTNLIISIAFFAIATVVYIGESNWNTLYTNIDYLNCSSTGCILGLDYQIDGTSYKKEFNVSNDYSRPANNQIQITYEISNPSNSYMGTSNYNTLAMVLGGLGILFLGIWYYLSIDSSIGISYSPSISFYKKSEIPSELYTPA